MQRKAHRKTSGTSRNMQSICLICTVSVFVSQRFCRGLLTVQQYVYFLNMSQHPKSCRKGGVAWKDPHPQLQPQMDLALQICWLSSPLDVAIHYIHIISYYYDMYMHSCSFNSCDQADVLCNFCCLISAWETSEHVRKSCQSVYILKSTSNKQHKYNRYVAWVPHNSYYWHHVTTKRGPELTRQILWSLGQSVAWEASVQLQTAKSKSIFDVCSLAAKIPQMFNFDVPISELDNLVLRNVCRWNWHDLHGVFAFLSLLDWLTWSEMVKVGNCKFPIVLAMDTAILLNIVAS